MNEPTSPALNYDAFRFSLETPRYSSGLFLATVDRRGLGRMCSRRKPVRGVEPNELLALLGNPTFASVGPHDLNALIEEGECLVSVSVAGNMADICVAGNELEEVERVADDIASRLPKMESRKLQTSVNFWSELNGCGDMMRRGLEPRAWDDISAGYSAATREALAELIAYEKVPSGGRLVLWHGEPGTGKTNALRALAHEWREWCEVSLITDPERFIGGPMRYVLDVLAQRVRVLDESRPGRLIVLEDSGELLAADARRQSGQGLSRLLNLTDGLLGLGMDTIILITTNEPLGRLHPAVHRPGRCLAEIEFAPLDVDEATDWLADRGVEEIVSEPRTLAQLYAIAEGRDQGDRESRVGFA